MLTSSGQAPVRSLNGQEPDNLIYNESNADQKHPASQDQKKNTHFLDFKA